MVGPIILVEFISTGVRVTPDQREVHCPKGTQVTK